MTKIVSHTFFYNVVSCKVSEDAKDYTNFMHELHEFGREGLGARSKAA